MDRRACRDAETGLWLLVARLRSAGRMLGRATVLPYAEIKLPDVPEQYDALVARLLGQGMIEGDAAAFTLTAAGEARLALLSAQHSLTERFYDAYYRAAASSPSHAEFCRRVYGCDLSQHGAADMAQLQIALDALCVRPGMALLDFGCGDGRITEYIADTVPPAYRASTSPAALSSRRASARVAKRIGCAFMRAIC